MKDSKAVKLIALAYDEGRSLGFSEGFDCAREEYEEVSEQAQNRACREGRAQGLREALSDEALAQAKSQAYEAGYKQGLGEGETWAAENPYNSGLEPGVKAERERALTAEPCLSVWFMPCGPMPLSPEGEVLGYPPGPDKIKAIKAIREAYDRAEGYGLKEVKVLVETVSFGARFAAGDPLPQSKAVTLYLQLQAAGFDPVLRGQE